MQDTRQPFIATQRRVHRGLFAAFTLLVVIALSACSSGSQPSATATIAPTAAPPTVAVDTPTPAPNLATPTAIAGANASAAGSTTTATPAVSASAGKKAPANASAINGQLTAINGTMWTLKPKTGASVTVAITPQTVFGTKKKPEAQTDFTVGSQVVIQSQQTGTTVTATRVTLGKKKA